MEQNKQFHKPRIKGIMLQLAEGDDDSEANASVSDEEEPGTIQQRMNNIVMAAAHRGLNRKD